MRAFVKVREYLSSTSSLSAELKELRARVDLLQIQHEENLVAVNDLDTVPKSVSGEIKKKRSTTFKIFVKAKKHKRS